MLMGVLAPHLMLNMVAHAHPHSALLLNSSGQIEVTNWAIGSNYTNPAILKYKEIEEIYQTNVLQNY